MTKEVSKRDFTVHVFNELLPKLPELGNAGFRRAVLDHIAIMYGIDYTCGATHYNYAFKLAKELTPELVKGLGRPENKKGGRKPVHKYIVSDAITGRVIAKNVSSDKAFTKSIKKSQYVLTSVGRPGHELV